MPLVRKAIDDAGHPALLLVDTISSLASIDYRHDEWGVDVTVGGSQKGLMLPPGLSFNALSRQGARRAEDREAAALVLGLGRDARAQREGLLSLHAGHQPPLRPARVDQDARGGRPAPTCSPATTATPKPPAARPRAWGLEVLCAVPEEYSSSLTALVMPAGHDADKLRAAILERFDMSLGMGLGRLAGKVFRIGHLGDFNDLTLMGTLAGVEMGLELAGVPHRKGGAQAAMDYLASPQAAKGGIRRAA